jgi:hypothetical protein
MLLGFGLTKLSVSMLSNFISFSDIFVVLHWIDTAMWVLDGLDSDHIKFQSEYQIVKLN